MKEKTLKSISKLLVAVMIATIALPSGAFAGHGNYKQDKVMAAEVSIADSEQETTKENTETTKPAEETSTDESSTKETGTDETSTTEESSTTETTTQAPTTEVPTTEAPTSNPDFVIENGVLTGYKKAATDTTNKEIVIPASVTKINANVFYQYKYIEKVTFEQGSLLQEIGENAFKECTALKTIELPEGLQIIGIEAYRGCSAVTEIKLPTTIKYIYKRAFYGIKKVKELTLPEGLQKINYHAFYKMTGLTSLTIPSTVTSTYEIIGTGANVTTVTFANGMTKVPNRVLLNANSVKKVILPETLTSIGYQAFSGCTQLSKIKMFQTIKKIGESAFKNCTSLKKLTLYKTVKTIGANAFAGATNLTLKVYSNSAGKKYARVNNIPWEYTDSEKERMAEDLRVYDMLVNSGIQSVKDKYILLSLKNYVPQGTCVIGKYIVVSMYHKNLTAKSILLIYNKRGNFVKKLKLTIKDHVGSVTNVKKNLVVGINNLPGAVDKVGIITYKKLLKAKNGKTIKFSYRVTLRGCADFAAFDGTHFWAGRSANSNSCLMYGYRVKRNKKTKRLTFTNQYNLYVPANTQGLVVNKISATERKFTLSQSYGRIADSYLMVYEPVNIVTASALDTPVKTVVLPSMMEGICVSGKKTYMVFESAAGKYCSHQDNTSEIQIDKVKVIKTWKLLALN